MLLMFIGIYKTVSWIEQIGLLAHYSHWRSNMSKHCAQTQGFTWKKRCVLNNEVVPSSSKIKMMAPWLDDEDSLRGGSCIQYADYIPWETKFLILLPQRHPITALTVTNIHLRCGHGGVNQTLCDVLKRFWIPAAR